MGLSAAASSCRICQAFGQSAVNERTARHWFQKFRSDDMTLCDAPRSGRPQAFDTKALQEDSSLTCAELAGQFKVSYETVRVHLNRLAAQEATPRTTSDREGYRWAPGGPVKKGDVGVGADTKLVHQGGFGPLRAPQRSCLSFKREGYRWAPGGPDKKGDVGVGADTKLVPQGGFGPLRAPQRSCLSFKREGYRWAPGGPDKKGDVGVGADTKLEFQGGFGPLRAPQRSCLSFKREGYRWAPGGPDKKGDVGVGADTKLEFKGGFGRGRAPQ